MRPMGLSFHHLLQFTKVDSRFKPNISLLSHSMEVSNLNPFFNNCISDTTCGHSTRALVPMSSQVGIVSPIPNTTKFMSQSVIHSKTILTKQSNNTQKIVFRNFEILIPSEQLYTREKRNYREYASVQHFESKGNVMKNKWPTFARYFHRICH